MSCPAFFFDQYIPSKYPIDHRPASYSNGITLRMVNLIDIPSQAIKIAWNLGATLVYAVYKIGKAILAAICVVPYVFCWAVTWLCSSTKSASFKTSTYCLIKHVAYGSGYGIVASVFAVPVVVVWKALMIAADGLGILVPSAGKWARSINQRFNDAIQVKRSSLAFHSQAMCLTQKMLSYVFEDTNDVKNQS